MQIMVTVVRVDAVDGQLRVDVVMPLATLHGNTVAREHTIIVPESALVSRMAMYGLERRDEALKAILREHGQRLNGLPEARDTDSERANHAGGLRRDVRVDVRKALVSPAAMMMLGMK
jgi:hypothetical protein